MRRSFVLFLSLLVVLGGLVSPCAAEAAADESCADVLGRWTITIDFNGRTSRPTLIVEQEDDQLTGTWEGRRGAVPLLEVAYEEGTLKARFERTFDGETTTMRLYADVEGDRFSGELETGQGTVPLTGVREATDD